MKYYYYHAESGSVFSSNWTIEQEGNFDGLVETVTKEEALVLAKKEGIIKIPHEEHIKNYPVFVDCGAPSLYNKLSRKMEKKGVMGSSMKDRKYDSYDYVQTDEYKQYRTNYIKFLHDNSAKIDIYSNLDVINNPELTFKNQRILESEGLSPIPVFHLGCDEKWLKRYIDKYEYIALGGLVPNPTRVLLPWLDRLFKNCILNEKGDPRVKVHGFACTSVPLMTRYPWYSVDSATCRKLAMYGGIFIPEFTSKDLKTINVSSRDISLKYRCSKGVLNNLECYAQHLGLTLEQLSTETLHRETWNYLMLLEKVKATIPKWPWNFTTRESLYDSNEFLTVYFAGDVLGYEKEFWNGINTNHSDVDFKGRLLSYFLIQNKPQKLVTY